MTSSYNQMSKFSMLNNLVASLMSLTTSLVTTSRMQQYFNVMCILVLTKCFFCSCIMSKTKLTTKQKCFIGTYRVVYISWPHHIYDVKHASVLTLHFINHTAFLCSMKAEMRSLSFLSKQSFGSVKRCPIESDKWPVITANILSSYVFIPSPLVVI